MRFALKLLVRQSILFGLAALAYFGVRGLTEGGISTASRNAGWILDAERWVRLDLEQGLQDLVLSDRFFVNLVNWIYIWGHWPLIAVTLTWLVLAHRDEYYELRNAMFISGAIGLVIFATFPVTPPRLFTPEYLDTVTQHSESYRILQPPALVNKYAAVPSLHFGWNLLIAFTWYRVGRSKVALVAAILMPTAMGFAVVGTANHWVVDIGAGALVATAGLLLERARRRRIAERPVAPTPTSPESQEPIDLTSGTIPADSCPDPSTDPARTREQIHPVHAPPPPPVGCCEGQGPRAPAQW
ncbi:MAG: phosphatase PAP2 family protein [Actinomycetia bacterium]|nr:phosphatase PAP2 family protein [Actinomycetes bacterium]